MEERNGELKGIREMSGRGRDGEIGGNHGHFQHLIMLQNMFFM